MNFLGIDHVVLTVNSIEESLHFYCDLLGMEELTFGNGRKAIRCGKQKINLHEAGREFQPHAFNCTPGSMDICFSVDTPIENVVKILNEHNIEITEGPVERTGSLGKMLSVYMRDPDQNLVEISRYM